MEKAFLNFLNNKTKTDFIVLRKKILSRRQKLFAVSFIGVYSGTDI